MPEYVSRLFLWEICARTNWAKILVIFNCFVTHDYTILVSHQSKYKAKSTCTAILAASFYLLSEGLLLRDKLCDKLRDISQSKALEDFLSQSRLNFYPLSFLSGKNLSKLLFSIKLFKFHLAIILCYFQSMI